MLCYTLEHQQVISKIETLFCMWLFGVTFQNICALLCSLMLGDALTRGFVKAARQDRLLVF